MPELPEVETVTNALRPHLLGQRILRVETHTPRLRHPLTIADSAEILDSPICGVRRRAKFVIVEAASGHGILVHLGMTGSCRIEAPDAPRRKHDHVDFFLENGQVWRYNDPRRFGIVQAHPLNEDGLPEGYFDTWGPEPLEEYFDAAYLYAASRNRRCPIKSLIMDNKCVVGVGNIYASEALFRAGIRPQSRADALSKPKSARLVSEICGVLTDAIAAGGTTISDFRQVDGNEGKFARALAVYGRESAPCHSCETPIRKLVIGGRSTFYCPRCQR
ncbi:MAG: formamidopyrimidine-DNA glycosylase [Rhodothermales bacterium]|jgi:formamidopyrimidine-DNA glycosylase